MTFDEPSRPFAFLISTSGGRAADEMLSVLRPAIEQLGSWRTIPHPESSLTHAAAQAENAGARPVHLAIGQLQGVYLTPALPTVLLPLWDYPDVPTTDLHRNGRLNWGRIANHLDLILAPSRFNADTFHNSGVTTPIIALPIPSQVGWGHIPTWGPDLPVTLRISHVDWGRVGVNISTHGNEEPFADPVALSASWSQRVINLGRVPLRRLKPYLSNATLQKLDGYKQKVVPILRRPDPMRLLGSLTRLGYRRFLGRWVSDEAHSKLRGLKNRLRGRRPIAAPSSTSQVLHPTSLTLSGLVYSAVIDYSDPTIDDVSLISAAVHAFRDRPDVTILLRLISSPERQAHDLQHLAWVCETSRFQLQCRVVVVTGPISSEDLIALGRATSYHVETSRTRGWSLPMMNALASGRPVIAPTHSCFAEWITTKVGFPLVSHPEPAVWPIDAESRHTTSWNRVVWSDLRDRLIESAEIAERQPRQYEQLSAVARQLLVERTGPDVVVEALRSALERLPVRPAGAHSWG